MESTLLLRSLLFIPAVNQKMLAKIETLRPDAFILDLEDSVAPEQKQTARENIAAYLESSAADEVTRPLYIRCNDLDSPYWLDDLQTTCRRNTSGYVIPKFESVQKTLELERIITEQEQARNILEGTIVLILLVESMGGCRELSEIKSLSRLPRLKAIAFGGEDYLSSSSRFCEIGPEMLDFARKMIVLHAKALDVPAIDTVYKNFRDLEGLRRESESVARMGFDGKLAVHPLQIDPINNSFSPSEATLDRVRSILEHRQQIEQKGAIDADGVMLDRAHLKWALQMYERWNTY